jgi:hypothetical protein
MNKETLRMQMLAGLITESQYKAKLNEAEGDYDENSWNAIAMDNHVQALKNILGRGYKKTKINLGWGVDENELTISSKIYGDPVRIFSTIHDEEGNIEDQELYDY